MARHTRRAVEFDELLAASEPLARADATWRADGYYRAGSRLWLRRDGTWTARVVWRKRAEPAPSSIVYTVQGLVL